MSQLALFGCRTVRPALLVGWLLPAAFAQAKVTVHLDRPPVLEAGHPYLFSPVVTGAGARPELLWAVTEAGLLVGPREGVRLAIDPHGYATFTAAAGEGRRRFLLRATSRMDPAAFATVEVEVRGPGGEARPGAQAKGPHGYPLPLADPPPLFWSLHFRHGPAPAYYEPVMWEGEPNRWWSAATWDPGTQSFLVIEGDQTYRGKRILRAGLDGSMKEVVDLMTIPRGADYAACSYSFTAGLATLANGDLVVGDRPGGRILRITRQGVVTTLGGSAPAAAGAHGGNDAPAAAPAAAAAGAGQGNASGAQGAGNGGLAVPAQWISPMGIAVTAEDEIVFSDYAQHTIRRITTDGHLETLAGSGRIKLRGDANCRNDLTLRHPALAAQLHLTGPIAVAADGRILFGNGEDLCALRRDGTLATLAVGVKPWHLAGTTDNGVVFTTACGRVGKVTADGQLRVIAADGHPCDGPNYWQTQAAPPKPPAAGPGIHVSQQASFNPQSRLVATPGGGVLVVDLRGGALFMGPGAGERSLRGRVRSGLDAAGRQDAQSLARVRAGLEKWLHPDGRGEHEARIKALAKGAQGPTATPMDIQRHVARYLFDPGLAVRAAVALNVLDQGIQDLAAQARQAPPPAAGAGAGRAPDAKTP